MKPIRLYQTFALAAAMFVSLQDAQAQCSYAINEPNNTFPEASPMPLNSNFRTGIGYAGDLDYYRISVSSQGILNLTLTENPLDYDLRLYSSAGVLLASSVAGGTANETIRVNIIQPNYYYVRVEGYNGANSTLCYNLTNSLTVDDCIDYYESNNSLAEAKTIGVGQSVYSKISSYTDYDWYKVTTVAPNTNIKVMLSNLVVDYDISLYNANGALLVTSANGSNLNEQLRYNNPGAATYYIKVYSYVQNTSNRCYALNTISSSTPYARTASETEDEVIVKEAASTLGLYPNPAIAGQNVTLNFNTSVEVDKISIINTNGETVSMQQIEMKDGQATIQLQGIEPGLYIIDAGEAGKQKLVIQ